MKKLAFSLFLLLFLFLLSPVSLAVPQEINYQGVLKDSTGALVSGEVNMTFHIYSEAGTSLWNETQNEVTVEAGLYSVRLGSQTAISPEVFDGSTRYLEVIVGGETLSPRIPLISVPYAFQAEQVGGLVSGDFVRLGPASAQTTNKDFCINVTTTSTSSTYVPTGVLATSIYGIGVAGNSDNGSGVMGESVFAEGVFGRSAAGKGVVGVATDAGVLNYGVWGESPSEDGVGVYGLADSTSGTGSRYGVFGESVKGTGVYGEGKTGVEGISTVEGGVGVSAVNTNLNGTALRIKGNIEIERAGGDTPTGTRSAIGAFWSTVNGLTCTISNGIVKDTSLVFIFPYGNKPPAGIWYVTPSDEAFTVTSSADERSPDTNFCYLIIN